MHELSIALAILETAEEEAQERHAVRVAAIHLAIGPLSGVAANALRGAFELAREGSPFTDCRLEIRESAITGRCARCGMPRPAVSVQDLRCGICGALLGEILTGRELEITAMEIEP